MPGMERQFRPALIARQGEINAWGLAIVTWVTWMVFRARIPSLGGAALVFGILLTISAVLISLSNWNDRKTLLTISPDGINFRNGLRKISLNWEQIEKLRVIPDRFGERVHVLGNGSTFNFRTLSPIKMKGETRGQMGFPEGQEILNQILQSSRLEEITDQENGKYYARP